MFRLLKEVVGIPIGGTELIEIKAPRGLVIREAGQRTYGIDKNRLFSKRLTLFN